jgi:uncharacterized protein involved in exopolysaccharide biosynthesis/Mrp family chromosome partitioning ATPase
MAVFPNRVTKRDVARTLFRQRRKIAVVFCSILALAIVFLAVAPRSYTSEAALLMRVGRESVALDPTATTGQTIMLQKTQADEVNSALSILSSRNVLERVVEEVGADRILNLNPQESTSGSVSKDKFKNPLDWLREFAHTLKLSEPGTKMDQAVRCLESRAKVESPRQTTLITIEYRANSPELARDVVDAMIKVFLMEYAQLNHSERSLDFFTEQAQVVFRDLTAAQEKLRDRKNQYQVTSPERRSSVIEQAQLAMRQKVYDLEMQEKDLMSRYTDEFPALKEVRRQKAIAEQILLASSDTASVQGQAANTASQAASATTASAAPASGSELAPDRVNRRTTDLQKLNEQEFELAQLERDVNLLEIKYAMHVQKLEEARVNDALNREKIMNVKVAQPASLVHKPTSPKAKQFLIGAFVLAAGASLGAAFLAEILDQKLRTTDQVERHLGLPVLASFPHRRHRKRRSLKTANRRGVEDSLAIAEKHRSYKELFASLQPSIFSDDRYAKTVGVVGCEASNSKSRVAGNLALAAASTRNNSVLLIDADTRRRRISQRFRLNRTAGWQDLLAGNAVANRCVHLSKQSNLALMGPGTGISHASNTSALASTSLAEQLTGIKANFGFIVVDLPPATDMDGASAALTWIDEAVLVVQAEQTRIQVAQRSIDTLRRAGVEITGVILANRREYIPAWLYRRL